MDIKFEINKQLKCKQLLWLKNFGKVITIYLIIVTVIIEIIVKMMVILMNKDNNNK